MTSQAYVGSEYDISIWPTIVAKDMIRMFQQPTCALGSIAAGSIPQRSAAPCAVSGAHAVLSIDTAAWCSDQDMREFMLGGQRMPPLPLLRIHASCGQHAPMRCCIGSGSTAPTELTGVVAGATWPRISRLKVHCRFEQMLEQLEIHVSLPASHTCALCAHARARSPVLPQ